GSIYILVEKEIDILWEYLSKMLYRGWIRRLSSPALNKITIKNRVLFPLISKTLDCLNKVVIFIKLDFKDIYYWIWIQINNK
ncbi:hypothetical protein OIDMADRAFT_138354, partial [Oidiodendron maius Zn]